MKISKTLESAIEARDLSRIYSSFYTIVLRDPGFSSGNFRDTLEYVRALNIPGFMQPYSGGVLRVNDWNEEYWGTVASELMDNFCDERINHLEKVGRALYKTEKTSNDVHVREEKTAKKKQPASLQPLFIGIGVLVAVLFLILILVRS